MSGSDRQLGSADMCREAVGPGAVNAYSPDTPIARFGNAAAPLPPEQARPGDLRARPASAPEAPSAWHSLRTGRRCSCPASITDPPLPPRARIHPSHSAASQPASCGERRRSGRTSRQSRPSNKAANCAAESRLTPSRSRGQTNLPPSSRLYLT